MSDSINQIDFDSLESKQYIDPNVITSRLESASRGAITSKSFRPQTMHDSAYTRDMAIGYGSGEENNAEKFAPEGLALRSAGVRAFSALEKLLRTEYNDPNLQIASIQDLPKTRKEVKEVYFITYKKPTVLSKVWVFKANPETTTKELLSYHIMHSNGIPTGKPLGFNPENIASRYPYDIAVLGGILEHAGDSYSDLLSNMREIPDRMIDTSIQVARLLAEYHVKLTLAKDEFAKYGVELKRSSPSVELPARFFAGLGKEIPELVTEYSKLHDSIYNDFIVVSHGDTHLGNIITLKKNDDHFLEKFGIIDCDNVCLDHGLGDVIDFFVHYARKHSELTGKTISSKELEIEYTTKVNELGEPHGWYLDFSRHDSVIQRILWHTYEMFDPVRKDPQDIEKKAIYHGKKAMKLLEYLSVKRNYSSIRTIPELLIGAVPEQIRDGIMKEL